MPSRSTRRAFLRGKSALDALAELPDRLFPRHDNVNNADEESAKGTADQGTADQGTPEQGTPEQGTAERAGASYLMQIARDAMACEFQVYLNAGQHSTATEAALAALDLIEELEDQLSIYRPHSELSRINQLAARQEVEVERQLFELLQKCLELHKETHGAFDITAGPLSKTWGFSRRAGRFPEPSEVETALQLVGSDYVQLSSDRQTIRFTKPGVEINVNAIGKGFALDRAADALLDRGVADFLIHGGRSSILARGSRQSLDQPNSGWSVALRHPLRHEQRLAEVWLKDQALGTSGSGNQFFHFQGQRFGHVLDPRTGYPADGLLSATILAPSAAIADALATAAFVLGTDATLEFCSRRENLAALLVQSGKRAGEALIHTCGLAEDAWQRLDEPC